MDSFLSYFLPFLISFLIAATITPIIISFYTKRGWMDDPQKMKHPKVVHRVAVPRGGGLVIFFSILIAGFIFLPIDKHLIGIFLGTLILAITGFLDDILDLNPYLRLSLLFLASLAVVGSGIGIAYLSNPFGQGVIHLDQPQLQFFFAGGMHSIWILADLFAVVWIMWNMNIVNWSKGLDGQMPGFVSVAAFIIAILSLRFSSDPSQHNVTLLAFLVSGAFLGFLLWNMYPQKIMAGFGAGTLAGYFLAVLSILSGAKVATALLVLAIPTIDATFVILGRVLRGRSPVWGDRSHLHHRLLDIGWGKRRVAAFYWITTAILGILALELNSEQKFYTIMATILLFGGFVAWITLFFSSSKQPVHGNG